MLFNQFTSSKQELVVVCRAALETMGRWKWMRVEDVVGSKWVWELNTISTSRSSSVHPNHIFTYTLTLTHSTITSTNRHPVTYPHPHPLLKEYSPPSGEKKIFQGSGVHNFHAPPPSSDLSPLVLALTETLSVVSKIILMRQHFFILIQALRIFFVLE